jgi:hypothetical protein
MKVLGHKQDVESYRELLDVLEVHGSRWNVSINRAWMEESLRHDEPFLLVTEQAGSGSVLEWELGVLRDAGYVAKVQDEVAAFESLKPYVHGVRLRAMVSRRQLIAMRPLPIHVLGIVDRPGWADGQWCSPEDFYAHDLDHARFKVREDLLALGYDVPDYDVRDAVGNRGFLREARRHIDQAGPQLWRLAPERLELARRLLARADEFGPAAEWLLFEVVHEKSFPVDACVLRRELQTDRHLEKLALKCRNGFYREPVSAIPDQLAAAREALLGAL